jgi:hypothetical protein
MKSNKYSIICFTNKKDTKELYEYNTYGLILNVIRSFEKLPDSKYYIVSLKYGSKIYKKFVAFMRQHPNSTFLFLNENGFLTSNDLNIRDEPNTESGMYVPPAALYHIKELIDLTST